MSIVKWCPKKPLNWPRTQELLSISETENRFSNDGPVTNWLCIKTARDILKPLPSREILATASGTAALHSVVAGISIAYGKKARVLTQAFTFATAAVGNCSEAQVCDNDAVYFGPSFEDLNRLKGTFDILVVTAPFGNGVAGHRYADWCKSVGVSLVFDLAASPFATDTETGELLVNCGDAAIISLHETKPIGRGEGGLICLNRSLRSHVHRAMNFGFEFGTTVRKLHSFASNWRMCDIQAAFHITHLEGFVTAGTADIHRALLAEYDSEIKDTDVQWQVPYVATNVCSTAWLRLPAGVDAQVICEMIAPDVEAKRYYVPLRDGHKVADDWFKHCICLPLHKDMTADTVKRTVRALQNAIEKAEK